MYDFERSIHRRMPHDLMEWMKTHRLYQVWIDNAYQEAIGIAPEEIMEHYEEQRDLFGYDIMPFAMIEDDYLCVRFKENGASDIIYWSSERALESPEMAVFPLYHSIAEFLCKIS